MGTAMESTAQSGAAGDGAIGTAIGRGARPSMGTVAPYQRLANEDRGTGSESLADFLGLFSLGLGLAQVTMPGTIARLCGVDGDDGNTRTLMRLLGAREISHGLAILSNQQPEKAVWSRVMGDVLDLALLGRALANPENDRGRTLFATANVLAVTALDVLAARGLSRQPESPMRAGMEEGIIHTRRAITIRKPVQEVFAFWRDFTNLPRFMRHLESVTMRDERRSHWVAKAPPGRLVEWDAETTELVENELIAWRALEGADVWNAGTVRFRPAPGGRGTEVRVDLEYDPPFGKLGSKVAMLVREEPGQQVQDDLRHLKQVLEIGEVVLSDASKHEHPHPANTY